MTVEAKDLWWILQLSNEVAEISTVEERIQHFLKSVLEFTHTDILGLVALSKEGESFKLGTGYALGLDETGERIMYDWYIDGGGYRVDPFSIAMLRDGRATARRQDLLTSSEWYSHSHIEGLKSIGLDECMASVRFAKSQHIGLVARREWGSPVYTEVESAKLDLISRTFLWFFQSLETEGYFGPPLDVPTRQQQVLEGLLLGLTEKEIAVRLALSPRTVHKYVEHLLRHFGVNSRPKLMALWTRFPDRGSTGEVVVHH